MTNELAITLDNSKNEKLNDPEVLSVSTSSNRSTSDTVQGNKKYNICYC